jgi:hypothetical protein
MTASIADLEARLAAVEQRLAALERGAPQAPAHEAQDDEAIEGDGLAAAAAAQLGRILLIFGGAFFLRAITEGGFVPTPMGLLLGALYAVCWLLIAYRMAADSTRHTGAAFLAGTSVFLILPLLHEAATKFAVLSGTQSVIAIAVYCALALAVAGTRDMKVLAWLATLGGMVASGASLVASHTVLQVAAFLLLLGLATLWISRWRDWIGLQWLGAAGANVGVLVLAGLALSDRWDIAPLVPVMYAVALLACYLFSFTYQTHSRARLIGVFEAVQTLLAGGIVLGASAAAVFGGHLDKMTVGVAGLALGIGGYALAMSGETRRLRYRNFFYYAYFGLVFALTGSALLFPPAAAAVIWALLAMLLAWLSSRTGWVSLSLQCTSNPLEGGASPGPVQFVVAAATVACLFIPVAHRSERWGTLANMPQIIVLALATWEVGGLMIAVGASLLAGDGEDPPNPAYLAALRSAVLSMAAITMALSSRFRRWPESRYLVYPLLLLVCIKLFVEDFAYGHPASLFVALAFIGSALVLAARLLKRGGAD